LCVFFFVVFVLVGLGGLCVCFVVFVFVLFFGVWVLGVVVVFVGVFLFWWFCGWGVGLWGVVVFGGLGLWGGGVLGGLVVLGGVFVVFVCGCFFGVVWLVCVVVCVRVVALLGLLLVGFCVFFGVLLVGLFLVCVC
ncbi:hypothetical protein, partial [Yersinia massiliensis]|uniref:hypothetical protein n=1 Tax=Yersinia massiliensis TaxID=419257 RepID=UPI001643C28E